MIGIIVPAHNEHALRNSCLASLTKAALHPDLKGAGVWLMVVLYTYTDLFSEIVARHLITPLTVHLCNHVCNIGVVRGWRRFHA